MNLQSGFPLIFQQYKALFKKNFLLSWRNRKALLLQLLSPLFFLFLIFATDKAVQASHPSRPADKNVTDPELLPSPPITPCENKFFIKLPCYDFVWSGNKNPQFQTIVSRIMANNPGRPVPPTKVKSFSNAAEVDDWLFKNPLRCPVALHFTQQNATAIGYGMQGNSTFVQKRGQNQDTILAFQLPLQLAAEREIARYLIGEPNFSWRVSFKVFAHPATETSSKADSMSPAAYFLAIATFNFVLQMSSLVTEKENKLRQAMVMMGLYDSAYWLSWLTWEAVITLLSSLLIVLFGMAFQLNFFLKNNFAILYLVFFLFELSMTGFAFMLSAFIRKSSSATTMGFSIFIIGFLTQLIGQNGIPYKQNASKIFITVWSLFPPNPFNQALYVLSQATATPKDKGVRWSKRGECAPNDDNCLITINDIYMWLLATFFLWFILAIYFDNIFPNASGVRKSVFYFLNPSYWMGKGDKVKEGGVCSCAGSVPPQEYITPDDEDVLEEENIVKQQAIGDLVDPTVAVQIRGLVKTFPGALKVGCCCRCRKTTPYTAVKGLWINFAKDQLFCLLGPNGAGKTTVINCLTGITPVTDGDALIYGYSIRSSAGMSNIQKHTGVCPQFDILWDALSGEEHLHLFASIKGMSPTSIISITRKSLSEVRLRESAKVRAGSYSGGMKRRLSVAISLIGDPKLVIMDEPTTGMDPITRRHVWDIIENAKRGRAIVLTTHSMEEADILSDRIGIMAKGRLRCIGTSIRLKSRFGTGFIANINFHGNDYEHSPAIRDVTSTRNHETVKQFFKNNLDVVPKEENNSYQTYVIPHYREGLLMNFFEELQDREEEFGISDIHLGLTTLEEVFLNIARQAELESAAAEGSLTTLTLTSGESVQIPVGARFVGIPGTESAENPIGIMVEVYWEQDDSGALCIAGHSRQVPVPPTVQLSAPPALTGRRSRRRRSELVEGIVIDPSQVSTVNFH
ncbi:hypothetical protein QN277_025436 [Acacia crassicarpa]|uniref:ABC transporter domain-containing protein n=1 Tax=Acacia crassicarpa TaxID=499986 RepID=A0AAE1J795_9FABA|nr:hypothetical protein QN277_025436 [Acacia crassicarpa]